MNISGYIHSFIESHKFSIGSLVRRYKINTIGVLHIGANFGQEADLYDSIGFENIWWVEGYPDFIVSLNENVGHRKNHHIIKAMISDVSGEELEFSVTSNTGSSTLFKPTEIWHKTFSSIKVLEKIKIICRRLDDVLAENLTSDDLKGINFLVLDIEGAELKALNSMGFILSNLSHALIEVSIRKNFEGGPLLRDIDDHMIKRGFIRIYMKTGAASGDALYKKVPTVSRFASGKMFLSSRLIEIFSNLRLTDVFAKFKNIIKSLASA